VYRKSRDDPPTSQSFKAYGQSIALSLHHCFILDKCIKATVCSEKLNDIRTWIASATLETFELDEEDDISNDNEAGRTRRQRLILLYQLHVAEVELCSAAEEWPALGAALDKIGSISRLLSTAEKFEPLGMSCKNICSYFYFN
jgi:hypothetical protein